MATAFALSNGVFARIFPLAPAPLLFAGLGIALRRSSIMSDLLGTGALIIAVLFIVAGLAAIFSTAGLILAIIMSIVEAVWILVAAIAFARRASS